ncbi:hypothetical protein D9M68_812830 [compost metagenome]
MELRYSPFPDSAKLHLVDKMGNGDFKVYAPAAGIPDEIWADVSVSHLYLHSIETHHPARDLRDASYADRC